MARHAVQPTRGFTLVEVLVAVLVLSVGLLGLAAMQARGLQFNQSAYFRTQATSLAYDMLDRIRANPDAALDGDYTIGFADAPDSANTCETSDCTPAELATFDTNTWRCSLGGWDSDSDCQDLGIRGVLPEGAGRVARNGNRFTVTVRWQDRDGNQKSLTLDSEVQS